MKKNLAELADLIEQITTITGFKLDFKQLECGDYEVIFFIDKDPTSFVGNYGSTRLYLLSMLLGVKMMIVKFYRTKMEKPG